MKPATIVTILRQTAESESFRWIVERRHLVEAADTIEQLTDLLRRLTDPEPCCYDLTGYCLAHSLHERPCPHEVAKEMMG